MQTPSIRLLLATIALLCTACSGPSQVRDRVELINAPLDQDVAEILAFRALDDRSQLTDIDDRVRNAFDDDEERAHKEEQMVLVLRAAEASLDARRFACRQLAMIGTDRCVPDLAVIVIHIDDLQAMALHALESIDTDLAHRALIEALPHTQSTHRIGIVNALGRSRANKSVAALKALMNDSDTLTALAATSALGNIGTRAAAMVLTRANATSTAHSKDSVAHALLLCANRLLADGRDTAALAVFAELQADDQPTKIRMAAIRGRLQAAPTERARVVQALMEDGDAEIRALGAQLDARSDGTGDNGTDGNDTGKTNVVPATASE